MKQLILFILISLFWMNFAFCQAIVVVWGAKDSLAVKQQISLYLEQLDVWENIYLSVGFSPYMPSKQKGITFCLNSPEGSDYLIIKIRIDASLPKTQQKLVLAHEMIHVKQYVKKELQVNSKREVMWKGRKYGNRYTDNHRNPWENEAYLYDNRLTTRLKKQLERPLKFEKPLTASKIDP